jgi:hypothetical protein
MLVKSLCIVAACAATLASFCASAAVKTPADGFMVVNADGSVARATTGYSVFKYATGGYEISYTSWVYNCADSISVGTSDATAPAQGFATLVGRRESPEIIEVYTYDASGQPADRGFHLIVRC